MNKRKIEKESKVCEKMYCSEKTWNGRWQNFSIKLKMNIDNELWANSGREEKIGIVIGNQKFLLHEHRFKKGEEKV